MPWKEIIILRRQWSTVSKQGNQFYEKEVVGEHAGYSVYLLFSPLLCPWRLSPGDFIAWAPLPSAFQMSLASGRQRQVRRQKGAGYFSHSLHALVSGLGKQVHSTLSSVPTRSPLLPGSSSHYSSSFFVSSFPGMITNSHCPCSLRASPSHVWCLQHCK